MLSPPHRSDDASHAAIDRLTPKERECLDRWLSHATAKQIALELGVTHHAVEKRLKSARAKLGVTSTLEAARLLAAAEGYGLTASQSPEVGETIRPSDDHESRPARIRLKLVLIGVLSMSLTILAAIALLSPATSEPVLTTETEVRVLRNPAVADRQKAWARSFEALDKDRSGYLETAEFNAASFSFSRVSANSEKGTPPRTYSAREWDGNRDGRVSPTEFSAGMQAATSRK